MIKVMLVTGKDPAEFVENFNTVSAGLKFYESHQLISSTEAYIFYEVEEETKPTAKHLCADCNNYEWNKGCAFCDGLIRPLHEACEWFNVEVPNEEVQS